MEINEDDVIRMLLGLPKGKQVEHPLWTEEEGLQPEVFIYHLTQGRRHGHGFLNSAGEALKQGPVQWSKGCFRGSCLLSSFVGAFGAKITR